MKISELKVGTEYSKISNYGKEPQRVKVIEKLGDNEVRLEFTSGYSSGLLMNFNRIECERYLVPLITFSNPQ